MMIVIIIIIIIFIFIITYYIRQIVEKNCVYIHD